MDVWHAKVGSYGAHVANGRTRQVYDYFKLNAHVYPLDALSSETTSQAVLGYIRYGFCKNLMQKFSMKAVCRERYQALITLRDGASLQRLERKSLIKPLCWLIHFTF